MRTFPMFLTVDQRRIVIIGGGEQAAQKCRLALKTSADIVVAACELEPELAALAVNGRIDWHTGPATPELFEGTALVFVATGCRGADMAYHAIAKDAGALVNVVDAADLCDAITPSIVDRDPVVVAIGTEGTAPVLARQIKTKVEQMLEPRLGELAALAGRLRPRAAQHVPAPKRRSFWAWAFGGEPRRLHAAGHEDAAATLLKSAIEAGGAPQTDQDGFVSLVGAGPGSADLITLRAVQRLQEADVIFYDRLVDPDVLELARRDAERVYVGKTPGAVTWPQERINRLIVSAAQQGKRVVRLKCGDPGIFARGAEEARALDNADVACEVVPGVTAATAAAAAASTFLTERGETDTLVLTTGQMRHVAEPVDWAARLSPGTTMAIYMGVERAADIASNLTDNGLSSDLPVEVVVRAGMRDQEIVHTRVGRMATDMDAARVESPAIILVRRPREAAAAKALSAA